MPLPRPPVKSPTKRVKIHCASVSDETILNAASAEIILKKTGIGIVDAARLVAEMSEATRFKRLKHLRKIAALGTEAFLRERHAYSFAEAYSRFLESKSHLRERTLQDYRKTQVAICKFAPALLRKNVCSFTPKICGELLDSAFRTRRQRFKAYSVLRTFFAYCLRKNWCVENPVAAIDVPVVREHEIVPLSLDEIDKIFRAAATTHLEECVPAIALMLYAGIRPQEARRLRWRDIDLVEKTVSVSPRHSKTGGCRHVTISPRLEKILRKAAKQNPENASICPHNWTRKWRKIRSVAGWDCRKNPWRQDVLRHTFASYHLKYFKNLSLLQCEMGHSSTKLLSSRYLSMRGITVSSAENFWQQKA